MAQSFQGSIGIASVQFGELLDPLNDAVERLSSMMVWAIGSLLLQRLVLEVTSTAVFQWSFFCIGVATFAVLLASAWVPGRALVLVGLQVPEMGLACCRGLLIRIFVVGAIIRFIVPVFVVVSVLAAEMFLGTTIQEHQGRLSALSADVGADPSLPIVGDQDLLTRREETLATLDALKTGLASRRQEAQRMDNKIRKLDEEKGWRGRIPEVFGGIPHGEELSRAMERREGVGRAIKNIERQLNRRNNDLQCIDRRMAGKTCDSLWEKLSAASKIGYSQVTAIVDKSSGMVTSMVELSIAIIIKNILFPIVFLMIALKCSLPVIRYAVRKSSAWQQDLKELSDSPRKLD